MRLDIRSGHRRPQRRHQAGNTIRKAPVKLEMPDMRTAQKHVLSGGVVRHRIIKTVTEMGNDLS